VRRDRYLIEPGQCSQRNGLLTIGPQWPPVSLWRAAALAERAMMHPRRFTRMPPTGNISNLVWVHLLATVLARRFSCAVGDPIGNKGIARAMR
jgi:hypothetical protein